MARTRKSSSESKRCKSGKAGRNTAQLSPKPTRGRVQGVMHCNNAPCQAFAPDGVHASNGQIIAPCPESGEETQSEMVLRSCGDRKIDRMSFFTGMRSASCEKIYVVSDFDSTSSLFGSEKSDEELTSSDSEQNKEAVVTESGLDLDPFRFKIDEMSVAEIKDALDGLNSSIDTFITATIDKIKFQAHNYPQRSATDLEKVFVENSGPMKPFYRRFIQSVRMLNESMTADLDLIIHDKICNIIFTPFFQGGNFWGVEADISATLERLYKEVQKTEPKFAHRWRSLSISAAFQNKNRVKYDKDVADKIAEHLKQIFELIYPATSLETSLSTKSVKMYVYHIIKNCSEAISKIIHQSRKLSLDIQSKMLFSSLKVIISKPNIRTGGNKVFVRCKMRSVWDADARSSCQSKVLGTFAFGLDMVDKENSKSKKPDVTHILLPNVITDAHLRKQPAR